MQRELPDRTVAACVNCATDDVLSDIESLTDWICTVCSFVKPEHTRMGHIPSGAENFERFLTALDVPQLMSLALNGSTTPERRITALEEVKDRYLRTNDARTAVAELTAKYMDNADDGNNA